MHLDNYYESERALSPPSGRPSSETCSVGRRTTAARSNAGAYRQLFAAEWLMHEQDATLVEACLLDAGGLDGLIRRHVERVAGRLSDAANRHRARAVALRRRVGA